MLGQCLLVVVSKQLHLQQLIDADQARAHAVVDVVRVVGNRIGQVAQLGLQAGLGAVDETPPHTARLDPFQMLGIQPRAVFEHALAGFKTQVQTVERRVALF